MAEAVMTAHTAGDEEFPTWLNNFIFFLLMFSSLPILLTSYTQISPSLSLFFSFLLSTLIAVSQVSGW